MGKHCKKVTGLYQRTKLISSFIIIYIIIVGLLSLIAIFGLHAHRTQVAMSEIGLQAGVLSAELLPLITQALDGQDEGRAYQVLRGFFASPSVACVSVMREGEFAIGWPKLGCGFLHQAHVSDFEFIDLPFTTDGLTIQIGIDTNYHREQNWKYTKTFSAMIVAVMAIIALIICLLLSIVILQPLRRLQQAMARSTPENPVQIDDLQLWNGGRGELFDASQTYNEMALAARNHYRDMQETQKQLQESQEQLAEANRNFGDSVAYASQFQYRLLADEAMLNKAFGTARFIWQPRDLVGGDFLTHFSIEGCEYVAFYDCTGHGVPGGFMVMIVSAALDRIIMRHETSAGGAPACHELLRQLHVEVCRSLNITDAKPATDGLDCAILGYQPALKQMRFSGANIGLLTVSPELDIVCYAGARRALGYRYEIVPFETVTIDVDEQCFVLLTDGIATQIGAASKHVMGTKRLRRLMQMATDNHPCRLATALMAGLQEWQGDEDRRDDIMIFACRP